MNKDELKELIKNLSLNFIGRYYGEDEDEACYDFDLLSEKIANAIIKKYSK